VSTSSAFELPSISGRHSDFNKTAPPLLKKGIECYCDQPEQAVTCDSTLSLTCRASVFPDTGRAPAQLHNAAPDCVKAISTSAALSARAASSSVRAPETERTCLRADLENLRDCTVDSKPAQHQASHVKPRSLRLRCCGGRREGE
jgi:hypothetical protein